ncbi:MAG: diguanylate cyclase [Pseudomonadota bacterium]
MNRPFSRATIVRNSALTLGGFIVLVMAARVIIAGEVAVSATGLAALCAFGLFGVAARVVDDESADIGGFAVMTIAFAVYASLSWMSDGLSGSAVFVAPMLPLLAGVMLGKRAARNTTLLTGGFLLLILSQHFAGNLQREADFPEEIRYSMRVAVLLLMLVAINWLLAFYELQTRSQVAYPEREVAVHNPLTGLLQPDAFSATAEAEFARAQADGAHFSLALVEIDDFQALIDARGESIADTCLSGVADALRFCLRRGSDDVGRYDAQTLCILMRDTGTGMARVVEKFHRIMETLDLVVTEGETLRVSVSTGYCSAPATEAPDAQAVIDAARRALSYAQSQGGARWLEEPVA